jgi:hypothetical protein
MGERAAKSAMEIQAEVSRLIADEPTVRAAEASIFDPLPKRAYPEVAGCTWTMDSFGGLALRHSEAVARCVEAVQALWNLW